MDSKEFQRIQHHNEIVESFAITVQDSRQSDLTKPEYVYKEDISSGALLFLFVFSLFVGSLLAIRGLHHLAYRLKLDMKIYEDPTTHCSSCRFFGNNSYLPCAVNPIAVLTDEAINCSDYQKR